MKQMNAAEIKAREKIAKRTTAQLVTDFEVTNAIKISLELSIVRGWIMDELAKRDIDAAEAWFDSYEDSPRRFFLG